MFTPVETAVGGLLLHQATTALLFNNGVVLGMSGLLRQLLFARSLVTVLFFTGMAISYAILNILCPETIPNYPAIGWDSRGILFTVATSLLTGWGTKSCGGCTSGHMLCGISRLSPRSILATAIFFSTAAITFHISNPSLSTAVCPTGTPCYKFSSPILSNSKPLCALLLLSALGVETLPRFLSASISREAARRTTYMLTGFTFGLGLLISGMASPEKVRAFFGFSFFPLDISHWDPSLSFIIFFGIVPNITQIQWRGFEKTPAYANKFSLPVKKWADVDLRFVLGAVAFGIAWGLTGVCPGPAVLRAVGQPGWGALWFGGFWLGGLV